MNQFDICTSLTDAAVVVFHAKYEEFGLKRNGLKNISFHYVGRGSCQFVHMMLILIIGPEFVLPTMGENMYVKVQIAIVRA